MLTRNGMLGMAIAFVVVVGTIAVASTQGRADDARLTVAPAIYRADDSGSTGAQVQTVQYYGRGYGYGYYRPYRYYRPYYGGYYRPYYGGYGYSYPAYGYGYGYPAYGYGYGYPAYGYGYGPGVGLGVGRIGVGVGVW